MQQPGQLPPVILGNPGESCIQICGHHGLVLRLQPPPRVGQAHQGLALIRRIGTTPDEPGTFHPLQDARHGGPGEHHDLRQAALGHLPLHGQFPQAVGLPGMQFPLGEGAVQEEALPVDQPTERAQERHRCSVVLPVDVVHGPPHDRNEA
jgi:hypothetical protein